MHFSYVIRVIPRVLLQEFIAHLSCTARSRRRRLAVEFAVQVSLIPGSYDGAKVASIKVFQRFASIADGSSMPVRIHRRVVFGINASVKSTMNFSCIAGATLEYFQKDKTEVSGNINQFGPPRSSLATSAHSNLSPARDISNGR